MREKIKVVFIARHYPPNIGGAEKLNFDLAQRLKKRVNLILFVNKKNKLSPFFLLKSLFQSLLIKKADLFFLTDGALALLVPFLKFFKKKPIIIKVHGLDITFNNKIYQLIIPRLINLSDKIICISQATKTECIRRKINKDKCLIIPIGIEKPKIYNYKEKIKQEIEKKFKLNLTDKKIILSVGALVKRKGVYWFIKNVIPKLLKKRQDFIYLVVGGPIYKGRVKDLAYKNQIEKIIIKKSLKDYVFLLGKVKQDILEKIYNIADIFVMPNIPVSGDLEGFGIVNLEASSYGIPVVASNLEGISQAVQDKKNGFLIKPKDSENYFKIINYLLDNNKLRKKFSKKAQKFTLTNYQWGKIIQDYLNLFNELISKK